ncbi:MAG: c-type cytochrome [Gammaproteobacteria bacterium]|nr:c-type cytochrome [Gammaproteobacteria bacterium]
MKLDNLFPSNWILPILLVLLGSTGQVVAHEYDPENGEEINEVCAGCHGEFGQGGGDTEYPRLAGMPVEFIARQLHLFRDRNRPNIAMIEYIDERQMPDPDIWDISIFLSRIKLKTKLPPVNENDPGFDAYARLLESKKMMQIPRADGDQKRGRKIYRKECASCHGKLGEGDHKDAVPMLTGQYTEYLWRQVKKYRNKIRIHDPEAPEEQLLSEFSDVELQDIFAYLSIMDD